MPITEIRDTLQTSVTVNGQGYVTRKINLPQGMRNQLLSIEVFNDNGAPWLTNGEVAAPSAYQLFVSPFPMQRTDMVWGFSPLDSFPNAGQAAGDENVLYKEMATTRLTENNQQPENKIWYSRFPSKELGTTVTNTWYTPHIYITVLLWNTPEVPVNLQFSLFARVKQTKVSLAESSMGQYKEFLDSQSRLLTDTATIYAPEDIAGYTFPMWKYGGVRSELMLSSSEAVRYFNRVAANADQEMLARDAFQDKFKSSVTMVDYDDPFGDAVLDLPEWISLVNVGGITAGAIRPYPPPLKYADNGNTLMF